MATAEIITPELEDDWGDLPPRAPLEREAPRRRMTLEEFHALPEDGGVERMLIRGELWETPKTKRNKRHTRIEARIAQLIGNWIDSHPTPPGEVCSGEAGVELPDLQTGVGIDLIYIRNEYLARQEDDDTYWIGPPTLAVEILLPSDRQADLWAKVDDYLAAGVGLVWVVDPHFKTVVVYRPDAKSLMASGDDELSGEPHLPGFRVPAAKVFAR